MSLCIACGKGVPLTDICCEDCFSLYDVVVMKDDCTVKEMIFKKTILRAISHSNHRLMAKRGEYARIKIVYS